MVLAAQSTHPIVTTHDAPPERHLKLVGPPSPRLTFGAPSMRPIVDALTRVAKTGANVLLQGESGAGKEVAARMIHQTSPRANKPFIAVNCAVLTGDLVESELFGHEKGAFTGAHSRRQGWIELADGGTLFLDEVGELAPAVQAKLLRVLQEGRFERVGGSTSISVDVRWVAATNRDLRAMVHEGTWRQDLYHRLAVFPITLPPLRERREDIVPLSQSLVEQLSASAGRSPSVSLAEATKARLRGEAWPGNVRELRNVLERAMILTDGPVIEPEHLWIEQSGPTHDPAKEMETEMGMEGSLAELERRAIQRAISAANGNRRRAAERLGIGLRTLYDKLKLYEAGGTASGPRGLDPFRTDGLHPRGYAYWAGRPRRHADTRPHSVREACAAVAGGRGVLHGVARHHDPQHGVARHGERAARGAAQHEVRAHELHAEPRGVHPGERLGRRPIRNPRGVCVRDRPLHAGLPAVRRIQRSPRARRVPHSARLRRCNDGAGRPAHPGPNICQVRSPSHHELYFYTSPGGAHVRTHRRRPHRRVSSLAPHFLS